MGRPFEIPPSVPLAEQDGRSYVQLVQLMRRLLASDGCPWDREQTIASLRPYVLEEACEVMDAIDADDPDQLREELGDLAFQVVFLAQLAQDRAWFGPDDVVRGMIEKLVRRHPHVFADQEVSRSSEVESNWEKIKAEEKKDRPLLDNIPRSLPALQGAKRISERVATVGFDWSSSEGSRAKVDEELTELDHAASSGSAAEVEHELGDLLFAVVNYARHLGVDPETALRKTSLRFRTRFGHVEERVKGNHGDWPRAGIKATTGVPLGEMEAYWHEAKRLEAKQGKKYD
jgi:MazG family protein